ncbi:MAG: DUF459 domain-containing protein [Microthrixaceae bacterium]
MPTRPPDDRPSTPPRRGTRPPRRSARPPQRNGARPPTGSTETSRSPQGSSPRSAPRSAPRRKVRRTQDATTVWKGTVVALVVFVVLASGNMVASAQGMPLGWQRSVAMAAAGSIDRVANLVSLNRPYDWAADQLGLEQEDQDFEFPVVSEPEPSSPTTTALPALRVPTAAEPLRVVVAGDSTAKSLGDALIQEATDHPQIDIANEGKVSTGLARSDYFNWGARMQQLISEDDPELTVFMVGANDGQSILDGDGTIVAQFGTPEWETAYRTRVAGIMDLNHGGARRVVWVGEPNVGTGNVQQAVELGNRIAEEEAATRPWVTFFDVAELVAGPDGGFAEYVTLPDGTSARCYAGDGVHLSVQCLGLVIDELLPTITGLYSDGTTTTTTTTVAGSARTTPSTTTTRPGEKD